MKCPQCNAVDLTVAQRQRGPDERVSKGAWHLPAPTGIAPMISNSKRPNENSKTMKLTLSFRGFKAHPSWTALVEQQLTRLQRLTAVVSAQVTLEWRREIKPAFSVLALVEVPGPDFHVQATDHTLQAALLKAVKDLERQVRSRKLSRADRRRTNLQLGLTPSRSAFAPVGH
jgi:ribosome-associated translation inhibitor RaiA